MLKLIEYNKVEINESGESGLAQNIEIEKVMCCLMKQKLLNEEFKNYMETYSF